MFQIKLFPTDLFCSHFWIILIPQPLNYTESYVLVGMIVLKCFETGVIIFWFKIDIETPFQCQVIMAKYMFKFKQSKEMQWIAFGT